MPVIAECITLARVNAHASIEVIRATEAHHNCAESLLIGVLIICSYSEFVDQ